MPSHIDEAGHTKAFDYPVAEHWGESRNVQFRKCDERLLFVEDRIISNESSKPMNCGLIMI